MASDQERTGSGADGFTLIELLVVISIIALLSSVVLASLNAAREKGRIAAVLRFDSSTHHAFGADAVGAWAFDEIESSTVKDVSGNGYVAELFNSPTLTAGVRGSALAVNNLIGTNRYARVVGSDAAVHPLKPGAELAVSVWFKVDDDVTGMYRPIVSTGNLNGTAPYYYLGYWNGSRNVRWGVRSATGGSVSVQQSLPDVGRWHHAVGTFSASKGTLKLYIDGVEVQSASHSISEIVYDTNYVVFGRHSYALSTAYGGFTGPIDDVRIYSSSLTSADVGRLYAESAPKYRFAEAE